MKIWITLRICSTAYFLIKVMHMKDTRYAFCVARIRALETKLLTKQDIYALIHQPDYASALNRLSQIGYSDTDDDADSLIKKQGEQLNKLLNESVHDRSELDALYILNDYFNLKALVKCVAEKKSPGEYFVYPTTVDISGFKENAAENDFAFLKDEYRLIAEEAFKMALKTGNGKLSDVIIDRAAIDALAEFSANKKSGLLGEICAFQGDTANIRIALRCAVTGQDAEYINTAIGKCNKLDRDKLINTCTSGVDALAEYLGGTKYKNGLEVYRSSPSAFEKWCDDEIVKITHSAIYTSFGFAPVVSYFYRKNLEIKTVRMILSAIKSDIDREIIEERVRSLYA